MNARMSLGRQPPPKPSPACRNRLPIRESWPSASDSAVTSAFTTSHTSAIALMNEIFVARNEFAATLTSSAVAKSVTTTGVPDAITGANAVRSTASADSDCTPNTSRSGCRVSSTAKPSRRNSGFQATSTSSDGASARTSSDIRCAVPAGTVDLPTTSARRASSGASVEDADST